MKSLQSLLIVSCFLIRSTGFSQELQLNVNTSLTYKFIEFDKPVGYTFTLLSLTPDLTFEWDNSNKEDNSGMGTVMKEAQSGAINLTFFYSGIHPVVMYDRLPSFLVSDRIFQELKKTGESRIRLQDSDNTNELQVTGSEEYELNVNGKPQKVNVIHASFNGGFGQEIWVLDNAEMPVVVKLKADKVYELKSITN